MAILGNRRDSRPILLNETGVISQLKRIPFTEKLFQEHFLQNLIRENLEILPIAEIEPSFSPPISVGCEVDSGSGPMDNLLLSPRGNLTIVETKLWRNPEARREVVGQIIDYAKDVSKWTFEDLDRKVREYQKQYYHSYAGIIEVLKKQEDIDESEVPVIIDNISQNLQKGRFLLLVVGDGIRESVEAMAEFLQQTPQLQFTLALVELQVYSLDDNGEKPWLVIPQIIARTREITRAVVKVEGKAIESIQISLDTSIETPDRQPGKRYTLTEEEYFNRLKDHVSPEDVEFAWRLIRDTQDIGCLIDWKQGSFVVKLADPGGSGQKLSLFVVPTDGRTYVTSELHNQLRILGLPEEISSEYAVESAKLFKDCRESTKNTGNWSKQVNLNEIREMYSQFMPILESTVEKIIKASTV
ncbi:hypothetical protein ACFLWC_00375 [Chloroflexota bacterium]